MQPSSGRKEESLPSSHEPHSSGAWGGSPYRVVACVQLAHACNVTALVCSYVSQRLGGPWPRPSSICADTCGHARRPESFALVEPHTERAAEAAGGE